MLIHHGLQLLPSRRTLRLLARELAALAAIVSRDPLECARPPPGLRVRPSERSRRLLRNTRVSAW